MFLPRTVGMAVLAALVLAAAPARAGFEPDCNDLIEWSDAGLPLNATRFPSEIRAVRLEADGKLVEVELTWGVTVSYQPGAPAPGRGPVALACGRGVAVHSAWAAWPDVWRLSAEREDKGDAQEAARIYARALAGLRQSGVRSDRVFRLPGPWLVPAAAIRAAIAAGDVDRANELLIRVAEPFPFVREGTVIWPMVADWMRAKGHPELAAEWDLRARAVQGALVNDDRRAAGAVERLLPFTLGAFLALPLAGLVLGLGLGARRRGAGPTGPFVLAGVSLGTLLFIALIMCSAMTGQLDTIGKHASAPASLWLDGMADPAVEDWARTRVRPESREPLLNHIRAEREALAAGGRAEIAPLADDQLRQALAPSRGIGGRIADGFAGLHLASLLDEDSLLATLVRPVDSLARALLAMLTLCTLGVLVGARWPRAWRPVQLAVPGASRWLGPLGGPTLAMALAALVALAHGRMLAPLALPDPRPLFGLDALPLPATVAAPHGWALVVLLCALAMHGLGVWIDKRQAAG